ncbi:hypothetical protein G4Y79_11755 [Phototrophicus methaneseepsis]|uniref:HPr kinase/phosphorylase C-terminal domain-containing protein n=1 Tax=Phototrophicus methaneseepsis TaxID=2710758 RepID=A0A7S8EDJ7_9CHLR|nr:hypothetical protein [Phototrophicus methaneseepsis]QPC85008.1 hypothetical protein G4Y79_11755 [Phototrophicus methaneseepsis]
MTQKYLIYGLCIDSIIELPELVPAAGTPDVIVHYGHVDNKPELEEDDFESLWVTEEQVCIRYQGIGSFLVQHGDEVIVDLDEGAPESVVRLALLGPAISVILHQRGFLVLHGSAISINGRAIAIMGNSGDGKSSLAASLQGKGYDLIADDLSVIDVDDQENIRLRPGYPQLKLWPDLLEAVGDDAAKLEQVSPNIDKRAKRLQAGFVDQPVPLHRIYVLGVADSVAVEPLSGQEAFMQLVYNSHNVFLLDDTGTSQSHFFQCAQLIKHVPVCRLQRPWSLDHMPDVIRAIEEDVTTSEPTINT